MSILNLDTLLENQLQAAGELNPNAPQTRLHFPSGQTIVVPTALLLGTAASVGDTSATQPISAEMSHAPRQRPEEAVIPVVEEHLEISKRLVETARVRLTRGVEEFTQHVSVPLTETHWQIEHVPINQPVSERPEPRQSGESMIFPLLEERLVVQRELFLREEVHVRKITTTVEKSADFTLKRDVITEERTALPDR